MRRPTIAVLLLGLVLVAGCGIPVDHAAHSFVVVQAPTPPAEVGQPRPIAIYFVEDHKLVSRQRQISLTASSAAEGILDELLVGPSAAEKALKISTAIATPSAITVTNPPVHGVITVSLDTNFLDIQGQLLYEAYGQVVYTLTAPGLGANKVQFVVGTEKWPLVLEPSPITSGPTAASGATVSTGLVSRANYCEIALGGCKGISPPTTVGATQ